MNKTDRVFELVSRLFEEYGFPLVVDRHILPDEEFKLHESEKERKRLSMKEGSRYVRRNRLTFEQMDPVFFCETFGVLPEELSELGK